MVDYAEMIGRLFSSFFWQIQNVYAIYRQMHTEGYSKDIMDMHFTEKQCENK